MRFRTYLVSSPLVEPLLAFSEDANDQKLSEKQDKNFYMFYQKLLSHAVGVEWWSNDGWSKFIFSHDTILPGEYRVSVFSKDGKACYHVSRKTLAELMNEAEFPFDGRTLMVVI
ncbi:hypothetical protein ACTNDZ_12185 [Selenomonas montiformis]|uniref:hypothetical protein n=1 Tax=Selenomonas montiformis TaxID=2652285 RepID=UPI003F8A1211